MNSDHYLVSCKTNYIHKQVNNQSHTQKASETFEDLNFFSDDVNWDKIAEELSSYNWDEEFYISDNHSSMIDKFCEIYYTAC